jgi:hypothetical protein
LEEDGGVVDRFEICLEVYLFLAQSSVRKDKTAMRDNHREQDQHNESFAQYESIDFLLLGLWRWIVILSVPAIKTKLFFIPRDIHGENSAKCRYSDKNMMAVGSGIKGYC